jgi:hypothetical protein
MQVLFGTRLNEEGVEFHKVEVFFESRSCENRTCENESDRGEIEFPMLNLEELEVIARPLSKLL